MESEEEHMRDEECDTHKTKKRTILAFGVIGFLLDFFLSISINATQDILEATKIPTSVVLLAASGPACFTTAVYPYIFQRISVSVSCCLFFTLSVTGMLITSLAGDPIIKVTGVCLVSFGISGTESVFYPLTSLYGGSTINSYAFGSGTSLLMAPLSYIGMTMVICLSPQISLLLVTTLWVLLPVSYIVMENPSNGDHPNPNPKSFKEIPYSPLESNSGDDASETKLTIIEMLSLLWQTKPLFLGLFASNVCKQLLVAGVMTTVAFSNDLVAPRNQYLLYVLASGTGDLLGRPYLGYLSNCGIADNFAIRKPWILSLLNVFIVIFMVFVAWFHFGFLSHVYTAAVVPLLNSFVTGIVFVNTFYFAGEGLSVVERRFCRAFLVGAFWAANLAVALISLNVEYQLREHCEYTFEDVACFTRSSTAWNPSASCVL